MRLDDATCIADLQRMAHRGLPQFVVDYVESGAEEEVSMRRSRAAFDSIAFHARTLVDVSQRDRSVRLFGQQISSPLVIAPMGFAGLVRPGADVMLAKAAVEAGLPFALSTASNVSLEDIARQAQGPLWFQLSAMRDRRVTKRLVERARAVNFQALVLTIDGTLYGNRTRDRRHYTSEGNLRLRPKLEVLLHPGWLRRFVVAGGPPTFENVTDFLPAGARGMKSAARFISQGKDQTLIWDDLTWLRDLWPGTLILKGILHPEDAGKAADCGVDGIVLSNHGGRQLDSAVCPLDLLPEVADAVGSRMSVLIDGGVRRGTDIVKAVALGANAVLVGRSMLYGVAAGGQAGVAKAIDILGMEIDRTLGLIGCPRASDLGRDCLRLG